VPAPVSSACVFGRAPRAPATPPPRPPTAPTHATPPGPSPRPAPPPPPRAPPGPGAPPPPPAPPGRAPSHRSLALAAKAGIPEEHIVLDPGIGFGKTSGQNRAAFAHIGKLKARGFPVMVGVSRKAFLGSDGPGEGSLMGTVAANLAAATNGAAIFRVHDVAEHAVALKVFARLRTAGAG
jgi:hypothetical protein